MRLCERTIIVTPGTLQPKSNHKMRITLILLLQYACFQQTSSYVTSGLPGHKHRAWLTEMTSEVCDTAPGELSQEMCHKAPQLLSAWAQNPYVPHTIDKERACKDTYPHHGKECAVVCERLLKRLVDERIAGNVNAVGLTNTKTYNALIDVWSRSGEKAAAAQRAEEIVMGMQDAYSSGQVDVQPDLESFRLVLKAWSQARDEEDAPCRAQRLLEWMLRLYDSGENSLVRPDKDCFELVIQAIANSGDPDAPLRTEKMIVVMDQLYQKGHTEAKPTRLSFNQVMMAWSRSKKPGAAQRAEDILNHMMVLSSKSGTEDHRDLSPSVASYSAVISAWAKSGDEDCGRKAEKILKLAERHSKTHSDESVTPDTIMYNLVIDAHAKTSSSRAHLRSRRVLDRQISLYKKGNQKCKPDVYTFTSVLSSCASLNGSKKEKLQSFEIAHSTFEEMSRSNVVPNHVTYGMMLKACHRLLPLGKERRVYTRQYFRDACERGCVGDMVMRQLIKAASPEQYKGLLKEYVNGNLPAEWSCRVPQRERYSLSKKMKNSSGSSPSKSKNYKKNNKSSKDDLRP